MTHCNSPEGDSAVKGFAIVPYIQGIAEPIRRVLNNCGIKAALKPFQTLGHIFAKPKGRVPADQKTHAACSISCGDCEKVYLGQTKRQFCTCLKEHQRAVSNFNSSKSALAEHARVKQAITLRGKILKSVPLTNESLWSKALFGSLAYQCEPLCLK